jgi:hypothetical protein
MLSGRGLSSVLLVCQQQDSSATHVFEPWRYKIQTTASSEICPTLNNYFNQNWAMAPLLPSKA